MLEKLYGTTIYKWSSEIPFPSELPDAKTEDPDFIYFPCCVSRVLGQPSDKLTANLSQTILKIATRTGIKLQIPDNAVNYCCGTVFSSKGYKDAFKISADKFFGFINDVTNNGRIPVILDSSSCYNTITTNLVNNSNHEGKVNDLKFLDSIDFLADFVLPKIDKLNKAGSVVLHPTCSTQKDGKTAKLIKIAEFCAEYVVVPENSGCCGFSGDRGMLYPGLTKSATYNESEEVRSLTADGYYSSNIPCEMGMTRATGRKYQSVAYLVEKVTA